MMPDKVGRFIINSELGQGGMSTVYLASDPLHFGRKVAIKTLSPQILYEPEFRALFEHEAKVIADFTHPCVVRLLEYDSDQLFLVMDYKDGGTLDDQMNGEPLPLEKIDYILHQVANALDAAHAAGIIHRDLKPKNVLFDKAGHVFLTDFGLAKLMDESYITGYGTPAYMSPEQARGIVKNLTPQSDLYSLGVLLYEMLSGRQPYEADEPLALAYQHVNDPFPPLDVATLKLPAECNLILARATAKEPRDRYETAGQLAKAFKSIVSESKMLPPPPPVMPPVEPVPPEIPGGEDDDSITHEANPVQYISWYLAKFLRRSWLKDHPKPNFKHLYLQVQTLITIIVWFLAAVLAIWLGIVITQGPTPPPTSNPTSATAHTSLPLLATFTSTPSSTSTSTVMGMATDTATVTLTPSFTATPTGTASATPTVTVTLTPTVTPIVPSPTVTHTLTPTQRPPTKVPTIPTRTNTPVPPTQTDTPIPPTTEKPNPTYTRTPTPTKTPVIPPTPTGTPVILPTTVTPSIAH